MESLRMVPIEAHNDFFAHGDFNSQLFISHSKTDLIRQWILSIIIDVANLDVIQTYMVLIF